MKTSLLQEEDIIIDDCWNHIGIWGNETQRCPKLEKVTHCQNCTVYADSGRKLLERRLPDEYMNEWTNILTHKKGDEQISKLSVIVFRVGEEWFALKTNILKEVTEMRPVHSLPHRKNRIVRGLTSIRGELYLCLSLGYLFDLDRTSLKDDTEKKVHNRLVIIEKDSDRFVFPVNEILGIHHFSPGSLHTPPTTSSKASTTYITGVIEHADKHIGCIDDELLVHTFSRKLS